MADPNSNSILFAIRRRVRRVGYRIQDAAVAAKRIPAWIGSRVHKVWFELSLRVRRRVVIGAAILAAAAAFVLLAVPALPCGFPGGDRCPPPDDAAALVPGDALLYLHVNTDPGTEQYERAVAFADELPTIAQQVVARLPGAAGAGVDYDKDVRPWLGGEAAVALIPGGGNKVDQALLLEVADTDGAQRFVNELAGRDARSEDYHEVAVTSRGDVSTATVEGFLVLGPQTAVRRVIDTDLEAGRSLGDSDAAADAADELPDDSLVQVFISEQGADDLFRAGALLGSFEAFVNSDATRGSAAALVVGDDGIEIETHSLLDSERLASSPGFFEAFSPFEPTLADELSSGSLLYLGLGDPEQSAKALIAQATAEAPGLVAGLEDFSKQLEDVGNVNLQRELLPLLGGEVALGIEPPPGGGAESGSGGGEAEVFEPALPEGIEPGGPAPLPEERGELTFTGVPYLSFVADDVDEEAARKSLADLQVPIAEALDPGESGQAPVFEGTEIEGLQARSLRISPTVNLTYAIFDDKLVVATDPAGVKQVKSGESSLDDADGFERATDDFPDELSAIAYLNVGDLIALAEQEGLGADPAYALFASEIRKLEGMGLEVTRDEEGIEARLRVTVEE